MANKVKWAVETPVILASGTQLNGLAATTGKAIGIVYDNATNKYRYADFELDLVGFSAAPTAGAYAELHMVYAYDGTNYADGASGVMNTSSQLGGATLQGIFPIVAIATKQYIQCPGIQLSPYKFIPAIVNTCDKIIGSGLNAGWSLTQDNELVMYPYNEELQ